MKYRIIKRKDGWFEIQFKLLFFWIRHEFSIFYDLSDALRKKEKLINEKTGHKMAEVIEHFTL